MKLIVLSNTKYKENDVIYNAISEESYFSFKASGAQKQNSKILWLNNALTYADVEFADRRYKYPTLKEAKLIDAPLVDDSLEVMMSYALIAEATNKMLQDEEKHLLFKDILASTKAIKSGADYLLVSLIFLANAIKIAGSKPEIDKCIFCGKTKDIVAFSFSEGGFICRDCLDEDMDIPSLTPNHMKLIRYIFKAPDYSCKASELFDEQDKIYILKHLTDYINDDIGVVLNSAKQLIK